MTGRWAILVLLVGLTALAAPAPIAEPDDVVKDRKGFLPWRKHGALKGKVTGVLISNVAPFMGHEGRSGPPDAMGFSTDGESYRWVYVPVTEKALITNLQVEVSDRPGKTKLYPMLSMANATEVKRWGITSPYSLVEVEVNDGEGSPGVEGFVATKMTRLDGTKKYPLDVTKVLEEVRKRYAADLKGKQKAIDAALEKEQKKVAKDRKATGPRETSEVMYLTWLPAKEVLRVAFRTRISDGAYSFLPGGGARPPLPPPLPPRGGARPMAFRPPPPPPMFQVKVGVTWSVELGVAYEIDAKGKVVRVQVLPIEASSQELPPPPGAGGPRGGPRGGAIAPPMIGD